MKKNIKKCDIIIPVYNAPQWVKLCVYALFKNTSNDVLNKVILVDDCSKLVTKDLLSNLQKKYGDKVEIITNKNNLGFVKNCNLGFKRSDADYILLLNTDCLVSKGTIEKMIQQCENDKNIGLICPLANNSANISLDMFPGYSYTQMDVLLEKKFSGMNFDACTIVGNCLMITRDCYNKTGDLDEIFGTGYGEETDYQFRAMKNGFAAKVAIDTYVYHKSEVSFGTSVEKQKRLDHNRKIFFDRHGEEYDELLKIYEQNDPIKYIFENITEEDIKMELDNIIYLPTLVQNAGGVHMVVDMINYLIINGVKINLLYNNMLKYDEIMLFNPVSMSDVDKFDFKNIISTIHSSTYVAKKIADEKNIPLISFIQGYETLFENGAIYGAVELTYKLADRLLCISDYLATELKLNFNKGSDVIYNGINYDLLFKDKENKTISSVLVVLRGNAMKGDWILMDVMKKLSLKFNKLEFNIVYMNEYIEFPNFGDLKVNLYKGPISRESVAEIMKKSDIYIDASLNEGFGLTPLEAMASGCVPIVSNSFGIDAYIKDGKNGLIVDKVNDSNCYVDAFDRIYTDKDMYLKLREQSQKDSLNFDYDNVIDKYIGYFNVKKIKRKNISLTKEEQEIVDFHQKLNVSNTSFSTKANNFIRYIPKPIKNKMKKIITKLYGMYHH